MEKCAFGDDHSVDICVMMLKYSTFDRGVLSAETCSLRLCLDNQSLLRLEEPRLSTHLLGHNVK